MAPGTKEAPRSMVAAPTTVLVPTKVLSKAHVAPMTGSGVSISQMDLISIEASKTYIAPIDLMDPKTLVAPKTPAAPSIQLNFIPISTHNLEFLK